MSFEGNMAMGVLRLVTRIGNVEITDPEEYLASAQKYNQKHAPHKLRDHRAVYHYFKVDGCPCILIRSKKTEQRREKAILYLHGGITNDWEAELMVARGYANRTGMDVWYPLYPSVTQAAASDIVEVIFGVYKKLIGKYHAENLSLIGTSFGGTFGFSLICRINLENRKMAEESAGNPTEKAAGKTAALPMPALYIANSPGGVPRTEEDRAEMERLSRYDPLIHISAVKNIIPMQELIQEDIPEYANSPMYGDFSEVPETWVYYAEETLAGNHLAYERGYARYGNVRKIHVHIQPGMMHGYSCLPVFKESKEAYEQQIALLGGHTGSSTASSAGNDGTENTGNSSDRIAASVQRDGFEGILYPGNGRKDKVLIVMSGSNGGMRITRREAEFYHKNGIPALALALFRTEQTPKDLSSIPVEYVENAIRWLTKQGYRKIGVDGMSKGSEMALVAASMFPEISCVIARVPSYFVSEGLAGSGKSKGPSGTSCWSRHGKDLPYAPYRSRTFDLMGMLRKEKELHIISFNEDKDVTPETIIPVERIQAPILLLSSKQDAVWPSYENARMIEQRLAENNFSYPYRHVAFEHMSHAALTSLPGIYKLAFKTERENASGCAADRTQLKKELLNWVRNVWS